MTDFANNYVWYVCYGSNMLLERFEKYIKGGTCIYNGKTYVGCTDKTMPGKSVPIIIPYDMYLANRSSWGGSVSFLDISHEGQSYGRAYLVTRDQFEELWCMEGKSNNWYNTQVELEPIEGIPAITFTNDKVLPFVSVSYKYMFVLGLGLRETYPQLSNSEVFHYLESSIK